MQPCHWHPLHALFLLCLCSLCPSPLLHLVLMHVSCFAVPSHTVFAPAVCRYLSQVLQRVCLALFKTYEGTIIASSHAAQLRKVLDTRAGGWVGRVPSATAPALCCGAAAVPVRKLDWQMTGLFLWLAVHHKPPCHRPRHKQMPFNRHTHPGSTAQPGVRP